MVNDRMRKKCQNGRMRENIQQKSKNESRKREKLNMTENCQNEWLRGKFIRREWRSLLRRVQEYLQLWCCQSILMISLPKNQGECIRLLMSLITLLMIPIISQPPLINKQDKKWICFWIQSKSVDRIWTSILHMLFSFPFIHSVYFF